MNDTGAIAYAAARALMRQSAANRKLEPHQIPPPGEWYGWALIGGRGSGKTEACARYVIDHVNGPACIAGPVPHWIGIIAPTLGDAATSCFYGPSGIRTLDPGASIDGPAEVLESIERYVADATNFPVARLTKRSDAIQATTKLSAGAGGLTIKWPNGSEAKLFGASNPEDVERLRAGGNRCLTWLEELAAWRHLDDCWDQMRFGLRTGPRPHWIGSTTPKPRPLIRKLMLGEVARVVKTHATMWDNPHLTDSFRQELEDTYGALRIGRQELYAELVDEDENALWTRETIDTHRVRPQDLPDKLKISVGVDPSGGAGEQGIVVDAAWRRLEVSNRGQRVSVVDGYVLADRSCHKSPEGWGRQAVQAALDFDADDIVVEVNFGGDMAVAVLRSATDAMGVNVPIKQVRASRGKKVRAEPVAAMAERGKWHHAGVFPELEDQMCTWTDESGYSPDRMDAMVWPAWHMRVVGTLLRSVGTFPGQMASGRVV